MAHPLSLSLFFFSLSFFFFFLSVSHMSHPLHSNQASMFWLTTLASVAKTGVKQKQRRALDSFDFDLYCVRNSDLHFMPVVHKGRPTLPHGSDICGQAGGEHVRHSLCETAMCFLCVCFCIFVHMSIELSEGTYGLRACFVLGMWICTNLVGSWDHCVVVISPFPLEVLRADVNLYFHLFHMELALMSVEQFELFANATTFVFCSLPKTVHQHLTLVAVCQMLAEAVSLMCLM